MAADNVLHLNEDTFENQIAAGYTLVDFWAEWCAPCIALGPTVDELAGQYAGKMKVAKVNIDHNPNIPTRYGIRGIPTIILFKDGKQADMFVGNSPQKIREMVQKNLG